MPPAHGHRRSHPPWLLPCPPCLRRLVLPLVCKDKRTDHAMQLMHMVGNDHDHNNGGRHNYDTYQDNSWTSGGSEWWAGRSTETPSRTSECGVRTWGYVNTWGVAQAGRIMLPKPCGCADHRLETEGRGDKKKGDRRNSGSSKSWAIVGNHAHAYGGTVLGG